MAGGEAFVIRRFWRLYPPFWITLLLTWWIDDTYLAEKWQWTWDLVMLPSLGVRGEAFFHFWTLEVELVFYCLVAVLFFIFGSLGWRVLLPSYLIIALLAAMQPLAPGIAIGNGGILSYLVVMLWGGLCREVMRFDFSRWSRFTSKRDCSARPIALGLISGSTLVVLLITSSAIREFGRSFELASTSVILGFLFWAIFKPVRIAWLSHVGRWTYSTYLLHILVRSAANELKNLPLFNDLSQIPLFFISFVLVLSFAVGAVAYRWIEQPSDAIGKRLAAR